MTVQLMVRALRQTSSSSDKMVLLKRYDSLIVQEVLHYAYHPFMKFGLKKLPWTGRGTATIEKAWPALKLHLDAMANAHGDTIIKNDTAKLVLMLTREDGEVFKNIIQKDLRCGISATTINKVYPELVPVFGIMKAHGFTDDKWRPDLMGGVKLEGLRCLVRDDKLYSSGGFEIKGMGHIEEQICGLGDFDGEIMVPSEHFQDASGLIRNNKDVPSAYLALFDYVRDMKMPFIKRYHILEEIAKVEGWSMKVSKPSTITCVKHTTFSSLEHMRAVYETLLDAGFEGMVVKTPDHEYQLKRSWDWMKLKNTKAEDCPIIGYYEGKGKYAGKLGGVTVERRNGYISRVGGGFSDAERTNIYKNFSEYEYRFIEVHYHEDTPDGDFRHARKDRWRIDLDSENSR